jgi:peptidylprolyl isomerase
MIRTLAAALALCLAAAFAQAPAQAQGKADLKDTVILTTKDGDVTIRLRPDLAPRNVAQVETLVRRKFYDGLAFHRVIAGFMAQTGDPNGDGSGGSDLPSLPAEFSKAKFERGTVGMARTSDPNSANSQFFICFAPAPFLDGKYTVIGQVVAGMDVVDKIKKGSKEENGAVMDPDRVLRMRMAVGAK